MPLHYYSPFEMEDQFSTDWHPAEGIEDEDSLELDNQTGAFAD